ncbi:signal peptidase I [Paenibacillus sp. GSMTC-2017]|uniref:signal peptidase I n=1 Tax=Paenibacillus sp. GSMTC-2017 TaxID=2794350 RepID=UPI0018D70EC4|nr:signal peptidase I [Paenibacillus sp. GSMTC-2017]MBH5318941.1 signal peptidase I [Paenibacillus sp. GSMTC-2017]
MSIFKLLVDWLKTIVTALVIVLVLHYFVFNLSTVQGDSMKPTLEENEWLFVNKIVYLIGSPNVGEVIIMKDPNGVPGKEKFFVKRIVGMPGDRIEISGQKLYRNGNLVDEPYTDTLIEDMDYGPEVISDGHYFVLGDNRHAGASEDSRSFNAVPKKLIQGRADFILWPIGKIEAL